MSYEVVKVIKGTDYIVDDGMHDFFFQDYLSHSKNLLYSKNFFVSGLIFNPSLKFISTLFPDTFREKQDKIRI